MGLEAVEIILGWENAFGIKLSDDEAETLQTPQMAIELICSKVGAIVNSTGVCLEARAYYRIRKAFCDVVGLSRKEIQLDSKLVNFLPRKQRQEMWKSVYLSAGFPKLPNLKFGVGVFFLPITLRDVVDEIVVHYPSFLASEDERWTRSQVRSVVQAVVRIVVRRCDFQDDDDFSRLGI
jgi:hypothetical protein